MPVVNPEKLVKLQHSPDYIRNLCVLAHVDHGKTSLTDSLIATNGIISPKMAGKIRYLDSRPDEQIRGITMESSAISLFFNYVRRSDHGAEPDQHEYLINLIDSPGHVDFSSEVSIASRLCDGAIVLIDAVEGVCSQTVTVLRQTWIEHLKPVLVINKMDRLITELKMSPLEAYSHLSKLLEQVNAVMGSFFQGERMEDDLKWRETVESRIASKAQGETDGNIAGPIWEAPESRDSNDIQLGSTYAEKDDENIYFEPEKGNVIFSSATDGWAFTIKQFARFYEKKLGIKSASLEKVLWGDFYLEPKTKKVLGPKHLKGRALKPIFVQLVLESVWGVYEATVGDGTGKGNMGMVEKITKSLSITLPPQVLRSRDPRALLTALCAVWIPLSLAVLATVIEQLPSPPIAQAERMQSLLEASPGSAYIDSTVSEAMQQLRKTRTDPIVAFVSKMISIPEKDLPENKTKKGGGLTAGEALELARKKRAEIARAQAALKGERPDVAELREALNDTAIGKAGQSGADDSENNTANETERLIGFARLFSGTLEIGDEVYVLSPKFSPANPHASPEPQKVTITALYLLMGRGLEPLTSVPAGVVFGVGGLQGHIMKSGTLCSQLEGSVNLAGLSMGNQPIVRVALEPQNPTDLDKMITGLRLLQQSDPCATYEVLENGEHVILTAGELHLERCLKDLRERFARCEIQVGSSIVPFKESIISAVEMNPPHEKDLPRGTVIGIVSSKQLSIRLRVRPLPLQVTEFMVENMATLQNIYQEHILDGLEDDNYDESAINQVLSTISDATPTKSLKTLKEGLKQVFDQLTNERDVWKDVADKIVDFGPRRNGPNLLIDATVASKCNESVIKQVQEDEGASSRERTRISLDTFKAHDFYDKIAYAFQLSTARGPLCQEPMQGVAVFLEDVSVTRPASEVEDNSELAISRHNVGRLTGEIFKTVRASIHQGFLDWSPRLLLAMYSCEIQASTEVLGRVYGVITRRRGRILSEVMNEGTSFFTIVSVLPVAESFGFSDEIRKRTSGAASPQLIFRGFEMLDQDPFWVPFTEEELEDIGEVADRENVAKQYMDGIRRRKGLFVAGKKLVESAEKQKTLKR